MEGIRQQIGQCSQSFRPIEASLGFGFAKDWSLRKHHKPWLGGNPFETLRQQDHFAIVQMKHDNFQLCKSAGSFVLKHSTIPARTSSMIPYTM
jgi:hypothetical protein